MYIQTGPKYYEARPTSHCYLRVQMLCNISTPKITMQRFEPITPLVLLNYYFKYYIYTILMYTKAYGL
jgi:hypothetical protein